MLAIVFPQDSETLSYFASILSCSFVLQVAVHGWAFGQLVSERDRRPGWFPTSQSQHRAPTTDSACII